MRDFEWKISFQIYHKVEIEFHGDHFMKALLIKAITQSYQLIDGTELV